MHYCSNFSAGTFWILEIKIIQMDENQRMATLSKYQIHHTHRVWLDSIEFWCNELLVSNIKTVIQLACIIMWITCFNDTFKAIVMCQAIENYHRPRISMKERLREGGVSNVCTIFDRCIYASCRNEMKASLTPQPRRVTFHFIENNILGIFLVPETKTNECYDDRIRIWHETLNKRMN